MASVRTNRLKRSALVYRACSGICKEKALVLPWGLWFRIRNGRDELVDYLAA
jgi:hypothetical protein